ncbi:MAG: glycoside hydrolase family 27 protein [Clostridia bacterium]|nr:glycoside hydrolase family 27 protein [Clostridia bacterium]MCR4887407.1 glycoside hydrolase family 27 protein [Clostridiales bacterium]
MLAKRPPLGWNSWNTFGDKISDALIREMADYMVDKGYRDAGYEYLVIDDCWSLRDRDENGLLVPDPEKFPHGMKALADYVHGKGLKFGMYSCAGVMTCAGYPSSYDHEFTDAATFASWGVDFLKYDFCNFPQTGDCRTRYQTMSMALKATGREILFSACNWGQKEPWKWMRSVGAQMYRSTGDIMDNYVSFTDIFKSQIENLCMSGAGCFNDMDMLTVGMGGKGNVGVGKTCTYEEYRMQFALWCLAGVPLMMGADLRAVAPEYQALMQNKDLLRIDQDEECRPPYLIRRGSVFTGNPDAKEGEMPWRMIPDSSFTFFRHLSDNEFALAYVNMSEAESCIHCELVDLGLPVAGGWALEARDVFTGENLGAKFDYFNPTVPGHDMRMYLCRLVKAHG